MKPKLSVTPGQRFGRGVVTNSDMRVGKRSLRGARLQCDCGESYEAPVYDLLGGRTLSCGCLHDDKRRDYIKLAHVVNTTHGLDNHPLMPTWRNMIARCEKPSNHNYPNYGARGIRVCDEWHDPARFIADIERHLGPKQPDMTLDRIDNDQGYRLGNVQYATAEQQGHNQRTTKLTEDAVREIRERWARGGVTQRSLAAEYGVGQTRISYIVNRKTWADVA